MKGISIPDRHQAAAPWIRLALAWASARATAIAFALGLIASARAEVRSLWVGIDVNCPPGLGECWGIGIRDGLARLPEIDWVAQDADGETQTAEVRSRDGRLIPFETLAEHLQALRLGARFRGAEATVDGWLDGREGAHILTTFNSEERLRVIPLTSKIQWDRRQGRAVAASANERNSFEALPEVKPGRPQTVRVVGPLRLSGALDDRAIETRAVYRFGPNRALFDSLTLGIRVNSPYGLGEPWPEMRLRLLECPDLVQVSATPDAELSTATLQSRSGRLPDCGAISRLIQSAGIGAEVTGLEATVDGRLVLRAGQLALKMADSDIELPLAPLTRKIQWNHRLRRPFPALPTERDAYARLAGHRSLRPKTVRVTGPVVQSEDGHWMLLEVREFDPNPRAPGSSETMAVRDTTAPPPVGSLGALPKPDGRVFLDWDDSQAPDVSGYHIYRSARPTGRFAKLTRSQVTASEFEIVGRRTALTDFYYVTALDHAGNESEPSPVRDARPPGAPEALTVSPGASGVQLQWQASDAFDLDSYTLRRAESPGGPFAVIAVGVPTPSHTDPGVVQGRTYYYVVTAVDDSSNESPYSIERVITP